MMKDLNFVFENKNVEIFIQIIKTAMIAICVYYTNFKITNKKINFDIFFVLNIIILIVVSLLSVFVRYRINVFLGILSLILLISVIFSFCKAINSVTITVISTAINYSISFCSIIINFVLNKIFNIYNDYINLLVIIVIHSILLILITKIKRWKYGITFLKNNIQNEYMDILVLNVGIVAVSSLIMLEYNNFNLALKMTPVIIINIITMAITIQKILQIHYNQKSLVRELNETKSDLQKSKQEIQKLEKENIELSKKNHSFNHKYKALEHKLKEELLKTETAEEISLKDQLDDLSKQIYVVPQNTDLSKTNIEKIDDILKFMQSECDEHKITFNLQVIGNIYHMTNNFISQEELEILIADHIKDAIIAINHSDNINKSILVKLGKIEDCYGLYIYDSGIEFEKETLENLGKKPITTHINEGGSGMGFMNTFDTLRRHNASLIIEELGKPCKENFTKIIKFRFDGKNEFKVISYRNQ